MVGSFGLTGKDGFVGPSTSMLSRFGTVRYVSKWTIFLDAAQQTHLPHLLGFLRGHCFARDRPRLQCSPNMLFVNL
jgi:hypothetical protein